MNGMITYAGGHFPDAGTKSHQAEDEGAEKNQGHSRRRKKVEKGQSTRGVWGRGKVI